MNMIALKTEHGRVLIKPSRIEAIVPAIDGDAPVTTIHMASGAIWRVQDDFETVIRRLWVPPQRA